MGQAGSLRLALNPLPGLLFGVRVIAQDRPGAIDLLGQHNSGEFVRISHRRQREQQVRSMAPACRMTFSAANDEHQFTALFVISFQHHGKLMRIHFFARRIQQHLGAGGMPYPRIVARGLDFAHLTRRKAGAAFDILGGHRIGVRVARLAGEEKINLHLSVKLNT